MHAIISYRPDTQKIHNGFKDVLSPDILRDICIRLTNQSNYIVVEKNDNYNKGRLLTLEFKGFTNFVTLSECKAEGRNSSLQSVSTAINIFYASQISNKKLWYYFLPHSGNLFTEYHIVYYKLIETAGIKFLNAEDYYPSPILPYINIDDIIQERLQNQKSNHSNNSSFITKTQERIQLYAKTYGANKYESTIFGVALSKITDRPIDIFAVSEQNLKKLPKSSLLTFSKLGNINVYNTSLRLDKLAVDSDDSIRLRSAAYNFNLLKRIGAKKCALCECDIPEIIHGAHIWNVADIRICDKIDDTQRYEHATSGHNGLWLCHNHHKLFDSNLLALDLDGRCLIKRNIPDTHENFINNSVTKCLINHKFISDNFRYYLAQRNQAINLSLYVAI